MVVLYKILDRFGDAINQSNLTKTAIAKEAGLSQQLISFYAQGERVPTIENFAKVCKVLNVDTNYILCQE